MAHGPAGPTVLVVAVENRPAAAATGKAFPFEPRRIQPIIRRK